MKKDPALTSILVSTILSGMGNDFDLRPSSIPKPDRGGKHSRKHKERKAVKKMLRKHK